MYEYKALSTAMATWHSYFKFKNVHIISAK